MKRLLTYSIFIALLVLLSNPIQAQIWTTQTSAADNQWNDIVYSSEKSLFVAVSRDGTNRVMTSPDGITWTSRTIPSGSYYTIDWNSVLFCAVGDNAVATSPDGITWTSRTITGNYRAMVWSGSQFVAVGTNAAATSPDGITWTSRTIPAGTYRSVVWTGTYFVTVGSSKSAYSADGITWISVTLTGEYYGVVWDGSQVVTIGVPELAISIDGTKWISPTASDYAVSATITGDVEAPLIASVPIAGFETGKNITLSDGVIWDGIGTPPNKSTLSVSTDSLQRDSVVIETTFGRKTVKFLGQSIFSKFQGGYFFSLSPGEHYLNVRNSGAPGDAPTIKYRPRYLGV